MIMESWAPGLTKWNFVSVFPFIEKLYTPVFSTVPASLQAKAIGWGIAIGAKVEHKGRGIFLYYIMTWLPREINSWYLPIKYDEEQNCINGLNR